MTRYIHSPRLKARLVARYMEGLQWHCTRWRQFRRTVFVCWNMRSVLLLRAFSVHSCANTEKLHLVICSMYQKLDECMYLVMYHPSLYVVYLGENSPLNSDESFRLTLYYNSPNSRR
ncbi:hypothetical protein AVEN_133833-1 [Araneus ventricosus]|uniref:Uncharacterized protein n=1 Tax=Araneus ventricosus TaxID=182803 RepID=A0A4Y2I851_ARAVE|nr:hypothetical protein AVEN_133833-1 [Araneus ventricosus]